MASMGFYSLHFTTLLLKPFTGKEAFHSCEIFLCVALGCLSYRLIRLLLGSEMKPRFKLLQAYVVVAMVTYISILVTSENTIIGVIGMFCQLSTLFHTLEKIYLELYTDIRYNGCFTPRFASSLHATSIVIFSLVLPLIYFLFAIKAESPFHMTYYSVGVFSFVLVLFAVIHVWHLSTVIASIRQIYGTLMESENSHLLQRQNDRQHYGMQPATSALIKGTNKVEIV